MQNKDLSIQELIANLIEVSPNPNDYQSQSSPSIPTDTVSLQSTVQEEKQFKSPSTSLQECEQMDLVSMIKNEEIFNDEKMNQFTLQNNQVISHRIWDNSTCSAYDDCPILQQVIDGLRKYNSFFQMSKETQKIAYLVQFFHERHNTILDDYIHVVTYHRLFQDTTMYKICDPDNCQIRQNMEQKATQGNEGPIAMIDDKEYLFFRDLMESLHCYLLHPNATNGGSRIQNRFVINIQRSNDTESEQIIRYISENVKEIDTDKLTLHLKEEQYDTDALKADVYEYDMTCKFASNIAISLGNASAQYICKCFYFSQCMYHSLDFFVDTGYKSDDFNYM